MPLGSLANWRSLEKTLGGNCLRISSYNVHGCVGRDGAVDVPRVARVIAELGCDVVGLQEVGGFVGKYKDSVQLDRLARETAMEGIAGHTIVHGDAVFGNAVLTRLPVLAVRRHDFSYLSCEPRGALEVDIEVEGKAVRVIVTHLGLRPIERRFQVRLMLHLLHDIPVEDTVVVLGDINEWLPLGRPLRWLHGVLGRAPAERSFPARLPLFALDRVWVRPRHTLLAFAAHRSPTARLASDHLPVKALVAPGLPPATAHHRENTAAENPPVDDFTIIARDRP